MKIFEITNAVVEEVSLVDKGANKRKFHIIKSFEGGNKNMEELIKQYKEVFGAEPDALALDFLKSVDKEYIEKTSEALTTIQKFKDDMPEEAIKAIETLATNFVVVKEEVKKAASEEVNKDDKENKPTDEKINKEEKTVVINNEEDEETFEIDIEEFNKGVQEIAESRLKELGYNISDDK
jgi:hypothetical protein